MLTASASFPVLPAADLFRARDFYRDKLGLEPTRVSDENLLYGAVNAPDLLIYETPNAGTAQNTQICWVVADIRSTIDELRGAGVTFEDYDFDGLHTVDGVAEFDEEYSAWFRDSEGNIICVSQPRV